MHKDSFYAYLVYKRIHSAYTKNSSGSLSAHAKYTQESCLLIFCKGQRRGVEEGELEEERRVKEEG